MICLYKTICIFLYAFMCVFIYVNMSLIKYSIILRLYLLVFFLVIFRQPKIPLTFIKKMCIKLVDFVIFKSKLGKGRGKYMHIYFLLFFLFAWFLCLSSPDFFKKNFNHFEHFLLFPSSHIPSSPSWPPS